MSFLQLRSSSARGHIKPSIVTLPADTVTGTTANGNGYMDTEGGYPITAMGFVWSTSPNPTLANNVVTITTVGAPTAFSGSLTGLPTGTLIYYDAYATNQLGTSYGGDQTFTTTGTGVTTFSSTLLLMAVG